MIDEALATIGLWLPGVGVMIGLTLLSGFFSGSETALFSLSRTDLQAFRVGSRHEKQVVALLGDPSRLLTAILFWNLMINLSYFAVSVVVARRLTDAGSTQGAFLISLAGLVGIILFGEVLPKSVSVVLPQLISRLVIWPLTVSVRLLDRLIPPLATITRGLQRGFWPHLEEESALDADDLEKAVDLSSRSSEMIQNERNVLHHILDLQEITAEELMRPRGTYVSVTEPAKWRDLGPTTPPGGFAAIVEPGTDQVCGAYWMNGTLYNTKKGLKSFRESVVYLPWCAHAARALKLMRDQLCHIAVVVNEYGETIGILTSQDLLDTIFSLAPNRAKFIQRREAILKIGESAYHLDGLTTLRFLAHQLEIPFDAEGEPRVTVSGMLHGLLKRFPEVGDVCEWQGWTMRVIDVSGPSRVRVLIEKTPQTATPEGNLS